MNSNFTKLFFLLFSFGFFINLNAQDTTVVQTFTFDADNRSDVFQFPDDATTSYEKILMLYTMKCPNTPQGCGEWDYSCNTFITDSSRVDSNLTRHPNFLISNFSGDEFSYTSQPTYTYYLYEQFAVDYASTVSELTGSIGQATHELNLSADQNTSKQQFLFKADELSTAGLAAGEISSLRLDISSFGDQLDFFKIKIKHSSQENLDTATPETDGFQEVYHLNTNLENAGIQNFNFYNNFDWDGTSNLLLEFSFTNSNNSTPNILNAHQVSFDATLLSSNTNHYLTFAGAGNVDIPADELSGISNEITVSFWANGDEEVLPVNTTIFEGLDADGIRQANVHFPWSNGRIYWDCGNDGSGYDRIDQAADLSLYAGQWNHWAFTKNTNTGEMKIYLNGTLWHSGGGKFKTIDIAEFSFASSLVNNYPYYGKVDELQIWDIELDEATIQYWMNKTVDATHPSYANLLTYFQMNEGSGNIMNDVTSGATAGNINLPNWKKTKGEDIFKNFTVSNLRPDIIFVQGVYEEQSTEITTVLDSVVNAQHSITSYEVIGSDLSLISTEYVYPVGQMYIYDENGVAMDYVFIPSENTISVFDLDYYNKFPAKYEILSLVTPYGNGLSLGSQGKQFTLDVTDYGPILQGDKRMSIEMGGQWQEDLDIKFLFIEGTPARPVMNVENIWAFRRGYFGSILDDAVFEPRNVMMNAQGEYFKIRSTITGHQQNGEFNAREHYINLDGGSKEFEYTVWKECADMPIYPQGGTWIYDRAGWCPGVPSDVFEFDITNMVTAGVGVEIDYGVNGSLLSEANYLVSNQLVTYGAANFTLDAAVVDVVRPSRKVEYSRINPACNTPIIKIQNTGTTTLTSLDIQYQVLGGNPETFTWSGELAFMEKEEVLLPVDELSFWNNVEGEGVFVVNVSNPNGGTDEYANNNQVESSFDFPNIHDYEIDLKVKTNNQASQNQYTIKDYAGNVVLERDGMANNTTYTDLITLPPGCYSFEFTDSGDNGLSFWATPNDGSGSIQIRRYFTETVIAPIKSFESEFGKSVNYDFVIPLVVGTETPTSSSLFSVYPNPTQDELTIELIGFEGKELFLELIDLTGKRIISQNINTASQHHLLHQLNIEQLPQGIYTVRISDGKDVRVRQVVKQ